MPQKHPAYTEESRRLTSACREIDALIEKRDTQPTYTEDAEDFRQRDLDNFRGAVEQPYFMRVQLQYEDGTVKDICFGESAGDIPLKDTYICGIGSPLRQQLQHRHARDLTIFTAGNAARSVHQQLRRQISVSARQIQALADIMPLQAEREERAEDTDVFVQLGQEYLIGQLDREASAKARSILATISERQDELMMWPTSQLLVVNGVAGSGKTAIAYHRIPALLHAEREGSRALNERRIAVFVPNAFLLSYLRQLLPRFGVGEVYQTTFEDWAKRVINRTQGRRIGQVSDETAAVIFNRKSSEKEKHAAWAKARQRGRQEMELVLRNLLAEHVAHGCASLSFALKAHRTDRASVAPIEQIVDLSSLQALVEEWRDDPTQPGWNVLQASLIREAVAVAQLVLAEEEALLRTAAHQALAAIPADSISAEERRRQKGAINKWTYSHDTLREDVLSVIRNLITAQNAWEAYLMLTADRKRVTAAYTRVFPDQNAAVGIRALHRAQKTSKKTGIARPAEAIDITELPLVLALKLLLEGPQPNDLSLGARMLGGVFDYMIVDEGQDLSPLQYALLRRYARPGQAAVFGDLRQSIHRYRGLDDWQVVIDTFGTGVEQVQELTRTFRTTPEITALSNAILEVISPQTLKAEAVPRPGRPVHFVRYASEQHLLPLLTREVRRLQAEGAKNIGIITRSADEARNLNQRIASAGDRAFQVDSRSVNFDEYSGGLAVVPISVAKGLEFDAAIVMNADPETYRADTPYDGPLLYTSVTRGLHHLTVFAQRRFTPLLGDVPVPEAGICPVSGLEITTDGLHRPPHQREGKARQKGQERGPGANHVGMVRTFDGRFDSTPRYEGDSGPENP